MTDPGDFLVKGSDHDLALISERQRMTFLELRARIAILGETLWGAAGKKDKKIAFCFLHNSVNLSLIYLSGVSCGHAVGLFPPALPTPRKQHLVVAYLPEIVFLSSRDLDLFMSERGYRAISPAGIGPEVTTWVSAQRGGEIADELALLLSTSGSTGSPKLVRISADSVAANASGIARALGLSSAQRAVTSVPLCYSYGLSILTSHMVAGSSVVATDLSPLTSGFWALVHRTATTTIGGTPLIHQVTLGRRNGRLPPSVRVLTQAGARLPERLTRDALAWSKETGGAFHCMYGQTEATSRISCLPASRLADKTGSVGTALPGGRVTVGMPHGAGADGPIHYTGPNVMLGYAACRADLARGREVETLDTGDLGRLDSDGFLYVTGRSSRFAKILDRRVSLDDIEEWLGSGSGASPVAAIAVAEGTMIAAFTTDEPTALEPVRQEVIAALAAPASTISVRQLAAMPRTANGKVDYALLAQLARRR